MTNTGKRVTGASCTASIPNMSVTISFPCDVKDSLKALLE